MSIQIKLSCQDVSFFLMKYKDKLISDLVKGDLFFNNNECKKTNEFQKNFKIESLEDVVFLFMEFKKDFNQLNMFKKIIIDIPISRIDRNFKLFEYFYLILIFVRMGSENYYTKDEKMEKEEILYDKIFYIFERTTIFKVENNTSKIKEKIRELSTTSERFFIKKKWSLRERKVRKYFNGSHKKEICFNHVRNVLLNEEARQKIVSLILHSNTKMSELFQDEIKISLMKKIEEKLIT